MEQFDPNFKFEELEETVKKVKKIKQPIIQIV
jgi:hypothetical protein